MPYLPLFSLFGFRHESGWPAIWRDCLGLIIVYNPVRTEEEDLVEWHTWFAKPAGLKDSQVRLSPHLERVVNSVTLFVSRYLFSLIPQIVLPTRSLCVTPTHSSLHHGIFAAGLTN